MRRTASWTMGRDRLLALRLVGRMLFLGVLYTSVWEWRLLNDFERGLARCDRGRIMGADP